MPVNQIPERDLDVSAYFCYIVWRQWKLIHYILFHISQT